MRKYISKFDRSYDDVYNPPDLIAPEDFVFERMMVRYRPVLLSCVGHTLSHNKSLLNGNMLEFEDLMQEALLALNLAMKNFDASKGVYFGVYLKIVVNSKLLYYCRQFLPHRYKKNIEKSRSAGKPIFDRIIINVVSHDAYLSKHPES